MSINAEENDANQSKFYKVISSRPVTDSSELFDTLSKFLMKDKKQQISTGYLDEKDQITSRIIWNNIRNVANVVLDEGCSQRDPVPAWMEQREAVVLDDDNETSPEHTSDLNSHTKQDPDVSPQHMTASTGVNINPDADSAQKQAKEGKRASKKSKKEARKRGRAEKRTAKKVRKEAREAKMLKKEAKRRRTEE